MVSIKTGQSKPGASNLNDAYTLQCGFRNRYMAENGSWVSDDNKYATCLEGNLDKLKYCKKVRVSSD